jgi:hypothetical protein
MTERKTMTQEEIQLRTKFYLAPKSTTLEELKIMNEKFTSYPGLTIDQGKKTLENIKKTHGHLMPSAKAGN